MLDFIHSYLDLIEKEGKKMEVGALIRVLGGFINGAFDSALYRALDKTSSGSLSRT